MNKFIEKFFIVEQAIAQEKGATRLFVLQELEEFQGRWDLIMSADWLPESTGGTQRLISGKMRIVLEPKQCHQVARIILLHPNEPFVQSFEQFLADNPSQREFIDIEINGLEIKRAYVIAPYIYTVEDGLIELWEKYCQLEEKFQQHYLQKPQLGMPVPTQPILKLPKSFEVGKRELSLSPSPLVSPQKMSITYK